MKKSIGVHINLYNEIEKYCKVNDLEDVDDFITELLQRSFTDLKYLDIKESQEVAKPKKPEPVDKPFVEPPVVEEPQPEKQKEIEKPKVSKASMFLDKLRNRNRDDYGVYD